MRAEDLAACKSSQTGHIVHEGVKDAGRKKHGAVCCPQRRFVIHSVSVFEARFSLVRTQCPLEDRWMERGFPLSKETVKMPGAIPDVVGINFLSGC